jgi:hypothetical protein
LFSLMAVGLSPLFYGRNLEYSNGFLDFWHAQP